MFQKNTAAQYISTRPIYKISMGTERIPVSSAPMFWWGQKGVDFKEASVAVKETETG